MDYDKAIEFHMNEETMKLFTPKELRTTGRVLMVQALVKEGYTVDMLTGFHVEVQGDKLRIRAYRGCVN